MTTAQNGTEQKTDRAAILAATDRPEIEQIELANRIVLRVRPVAHHLLVRAQQAVPEPQVPRVWIEGRGENRDDPNDPGWEENPDSPTYRAARANWIIESDTASLKVALILGTEVVSLPDGIHPVESEEWISEIEEAAAAAELSPPPIRREPAKARYLDWLRFYAIPDEDDIFRLSHLLMYGVLATEEELSDALTSFRSRKARAADLAFALVTGSPNRNLDAADLPRDDS